MPSAMRTSSGATSANSTSAAPERSRPNDRSGLAIRRAIVRSPVELDDIVQRAAAIADVYRVDDLAIHVRVVAADIHRLGDEDLGELGRRLLGAAHRAGKAEGGA